MPQLDRITGRLEQLIPEGRIADFATRWKIIELALFGSVPRDDFDTERRGRASSLRPSRDLEFVGFDYDGRRTSRNRRAKGRPCRKRRVEKPISAVAHPVGQEGHLCRCRKMTVSIYGTC